MTINQLCSSLDRSQQAYYQWLCRQGRKPKFQADVAQVINLVKYIRKKYLPGAGIRQVYNFVLSKPEYHDSIDGWSKHRYERLCKEQGLIIPIKRAYKGCTKKGDFQFDNLLKGKELNGINQAFATDMFYVFSNTNGRKIGYCTTLMDLYSRYLLGLSFSSTMQAEHTSYEVMKQCLEVRDAASLEGCIFHSDGAKQYIYQPLLKLLGELNMVSSMATSCFENSHAESLNDILKNHMLHGIVVNSIQQLKSQQEWLKKSYNCYRSHSSLGKLSPADYERMIESVPICQRTIVKIYHPNG